MSKENERGRQPLPSPCPATFCPMTLQHLFLTSDSPLGYGSLDPAGSMGSCLTGEDRKQKEEMNLRVGMFWDADPRSSMSVGYGATRLLFEPLLDAHKHKCIKRTQPQLTGDNWLPCLTRPRHGIQLQGMFFPSVDVPTSPWAVQGREE